MSTMPRKFFPENEEEGYVRILKYAVVVAIAAGIFTTAVILWYARTESYSALHLESYSNYIENGTVSFTYGVDRFGPTPATYIAKIYHRGKVVYSNEYTLRPGSVNKTVAFLSINETEFPVKLQLVLTEDPASGGGIYEVYFWLKGNR